VNGAVATTGTVPALSSTGNGAAIGMNAPSGDNFDGLIDELRVWKTARSTAEIAAAASR